LGNNLVNLYPQYDLKKTDNSVPTNPFVKNHLNSITNYKKLNSDLNRIQNGVDTFIRTINSAEKKMSNNPLSMLFTGLMSIIPATRRLAPIEDNEKQNNRFKALGLGILAMINLKEDLRDLLSVFGKTKNELNKEYKAVFKFFAGTPVENWLMKSETGRKIFFDIDKTLAESGIGEIISNKINIEENFKMTKREVFYPFMKNPERIYRPYKKFTGPFWKKVIMLSLNRITKLGLLFACILEMPKIAEEIKKGNYKQIPKSAVNILSFALCGAFVSAFGTYTAGIAGSVLGLGIGFYLGNQISKVINSNY